MNDSIVVLENKNANDNTAADTDDEEPHTGVD